MPNLLALETSSPVLSLALKKGKEKILELSLARRLRHSENFIPLLDKLLKKKGLSIRKIDTFLVGRGPGSFTGLRIGFAALKGFLALAKRRVFGALSLDLIAEAVDLDEASDLAVALDARREKIYARFYRRLQNQWQAASGPRVLSFEAFLEELPAHSFLTGDLLLRYSNRLEKELKPKAVHFLPKKTWYPKASALIRLYERRGAMNRAPTLQPLQKPSDFLPLYFRLSEAEEKKEVYAHTA